MDRLETKYRSVLRNVHSLPSSVSVPPIYLCIGLLPATAERGIEVFGLLGQIAGCSRDLQAVSDIIEDGLVRFDISFPGWSGIVRRTCTLYGLDDPLELLQHSWRSGRWRQYCKKVVTNYWLEILQ